MAAKPIKIRCSACGKANLAHKVVTYDVGPLMGMTKVLVENMPALVCPKCRSVHQYGGTIEKIATLLAVDILGRSELDPIEVRYLRQSVGDTQDELAQRLGVARATVNRWENSSDPVRGPDAYAIRSHAFFRLRTRSPEIEAVAAAFTSDAPAPRSKKKRSYNIDGSRLSAVA